MSIELSEQQAAVLRALQQAGGPVPIPELAARVGLDQAQASAVLHDAAPLGWVVVTEEPEAEYSLTRSEPNSPLPELEFLNATAESSLTMQEAAQRAAGMGLKLNEIIKWGSAHGWLRKDG